MTELREIVKELNRKEEAIRRLIKAEVPWEPVGPTPMPEITDLRSWDMRRLREEYLRRREREREEIFAQEAESGGATAGRAKLEEQGMEISEELKKIFTRKDRRSVDSRR